jgi:hypothetical protein
MNKVTNLLFMLLMLFVACSRGYYIYQHGPDAFSVILLVVALLLFVRRVMMHNQMSNKA